MFKYVRRHIAAYRLVKLLDYHEVNLPKVEQLDTDPMYPSERFTAYKVGDWVMESADPDHEHMSDNNPSYVHGAILSWISWYMFIQQPKPTARYIGSESVIGQFRGNSLREKIASIRKK